MTRIEQLPPDQRAVLSLLLQQRKSYEEVASALGIAPDAVRARAHSALAVIAPKQARALDPGDRERVGEYLLGQQSEQEAAATKSHLASSTPAREWARALAEQLVTLAASAVPEIPGETAIAGDGAPTAPISRRGGAILLGGIVVIAAVVVAIVLSSGGGGSNSANQTASHSTAEPGATSSSAKGASKSTGEKVKIEKLSEMKPPSGGGSEKGYAAIVSKGKTHAVEIEANGLPATSGFSYVVWLTGAHGQTTAFGRVPSVGAHGHFRVIEVLAQDPSAVAGIEISRETSTHPASPSTIVLKGNFINR